MDIKTFEKKDLEVMQNIVGKRLNNIFKQLDFFILNFGEEVEYSLHTYSFLRIIKDKVILLTSADEYYYPSHERMLAKVYKKDEMHEKSLLRLNIEKTKTALENAVVKEVVVTDTADLYIAFDNKVIIQVLIDYLCQDTEMHRFFKCKSEDSNNPHYVIKFYDECLITEVDYPKQYLKHLKLKNRK